MFDFSKVEFITERKVPANLQEIVDVEKKLELTIPDVYKEFLLEMNGAETSDALIYSTDDLVEMNVLNEVREYAPGFISIGSDNGDYELLMKATKDEIAFRLVDAGDMVPDDEYNTIYISFKDWINNGAVLIDIEEDEDEEVGKLILIDPPENGARDLRKMTLIQLQNEEIEWIGEKDTAIKNDLEMNNGGSMCAFIPSMDTIYYTHNRIYELLKYIK